MSWFAIALAKISSRGILREKAVCKQSKIIPSVPYINLKIQLPNLHVCYP